MVCNGDVEHLQLVSGIPMQRNAKSGRIVQLYGHYLHVRGDLSTERFLRAVELGLMPLLGEEKFEGLVLKSTLEKVRKTREAPLEKVYEFLAN